MGRHKVLLLAFYFESCSRKISSFLMDGMLDTWILISSKYLNNKKSLTSLAQRLYSNLFPWWFLFNIYFIIWVKSSSCHCMFELIYRCMLQYMALCRGGNDLVEVFWEQCLWKRQADDQYLLHLSFGYRGQFVTVCLNWFTGVYFSTWICVGMAMTLLKSFGNSVSERGRLTINQYLLHLSFG